MTDTLVSILSPAYNSAKYIEATIKSVLAQTYQEWELLIIDDCSTDGSTDIVNKWLQKDKRIKLIKMQKNSGPALARQVGLGQAKGRYIAFLDTDDCWHPTKLQKQINFMRSNDAVITYTFFQCMQENGRIWKKVCQTPLVVTYKQLLKHNIIACLTVIIDRKRCHNFAVPDVGYDDFALWLQILRQGGKARCLPESLAFYRILPNSLSRKKLRSARWVWHIMRKVEKLPLWFASWNFFNYTCRVLLKHQRVYCKD